MSDTMTNTTDFYYLDRPLIPATQQVIFNPSAIEEQGVCVMTDALRDYAAYAMEVMDVNAVVKGTVLYVPAVNFVDLTAPKIDEITASDLAPSVEEVRDVEETLYEILEEGSPKDETDILPSIFSFEGDVFLADHTTSLALEDIEEFLANENADVTNSALRSIALSIVALQKKNNELQDRLDEILF